MNQVTLTALTCQNCGAALVIIGENTAECDYCGSVFLVSNMDDIIMETDERYDPHIPYHDDYFCPSFYRNHPWSKR